MRTPLFVCLLGTTLAAAVHAGPPPTDTQPFKETLHGIEIADPYRWLEGSAGLEGGKTDEALDARVSAWTDAQNSYSRSVLDRLPRRQEIETRLRALDGGGFRGGISKRGDWLFYVRREAGQQQSALVVAGKDGEPRVLVDPVALDPSGLTTLAWYRTTPDGRLAAFGLFKAGDENATLHILETATGTWLADEISNKVREVEWLPDGSGFLYNHLADVKNPYTRRVRFHKVGTHHRQDRTLIEQHKEGPGATTFGPFAHLSPDGRWAILGYWTGSGTNDLWVMDFQEWLRNGPPANIERKPILVGQQAQSGLYDVYEPGDPIVGDTYYMTTNLDAPNKKVVAVDLEDPAQAKWREVIPERKDAVLETLSNARSTGHTLLVARYLKNASTRIERFGLDGKPKGEIPLPGIGWAFLDTYRDQTEAFLSFMSFNEPHDSLPGRPRHGRAQGLVARRAAVRSLHPGGRAGLVPLQGRHPHQHVPRPQKRFEAGRLQPHPPLRLWRVRHPHHAPLRHRRGAVAGSGRRLRPAQPARRQRIRRGLAPRRHAGEETKRFRRLPRRRRVADRQRLHPLREARHPGRFERRPADRRRGHPEAGPLLRRDRPRALDGHAALSQIPARPELDARATDRATIPSRSASSTATRPTTTSKKERNTRPCS